MRITKVKIDKDEEAKKPMVLMHRRSNKGSLILEYPNTKRNSPSDPKDETSRIIERCKPIQCSKKITI